MTLDRLRQLAQPGGLVDGLADDGVLEALLGADVARHHLARRHPDARRRIPAPRRATARPSRARRPSASSSASSSETGAPNTASTASPSNLLTSPWWRSTSSTTTAKNRLSRSTTSTAGRLVTSCVDPMMSTNITAAWRSSPPSFGRYLLGECGDLTADVAAEQVAHAFAFPQPAHHRVESTLQLAEFGAVEHDEVGVQVALLDAIEGGAHHAHRSGGEPGQDPHQDEAEDQREQRENHDGDGELGGGDVLQRQGEDGGEQDAEHGDPGAERPHQHGAAHDPRREPPRRRAHLECLCGDRAQRELGEQVAARRDDDAGKARRRAGPSG